MSDDEAFAIGDRVTWREGERHFSTWRWGSVVRVSAGGQLVGVMPDGLRQVTKSFRRGTRWHIRKETAHEQAVVAWLATEPATEFAYAARALGGDVDGSVRCKELRTSDDARKAAAELLALAAWLDGKPLPDRRG
jgi:hypothetical protein